MGKEKRKAARKPVGETAPITSAPCARCGVSCMVRAPAERMDYSYPTLNAATIARGMCRECAAHWWIFSVDGLRWTFADGPDMLAYPAVQERLAQAMGRMHPELATCDWGRMRQQWDLPWPDDWALPQDAVSA